MKKKNIIQNCKVIKSFELIKVEIPTNTQNPKRYFYNIELDGIEELLLVETFDPIPTDEDYVGRSILYDINEDNEVSNFIID